MPAAVAASVLLTLASAGTMRSSRVPSGAHVTPPAVEDPNIRCAANRATSTAISFERIIPDRLEHERPSDDNADRRGARVLAVIGDSSMWPAVWHAAVDSVKTPPVSFGNAVLLLATTQPFPAGPVELRISSIRQCRRTGVIVVSTIETRPSIAAVMMWSRGFDLVRVPGRELLHSSVVYQQRVKYLP
ncbi:MAG: hypothetical protein LH616_13270 [Ilumatobacteraceae bacterium]|nr:hypothetical protein [Ilumatobacteraceae bacterium]